MACTNRPVIRAQLVIELIFLLAISSNQIAARCSSELAASKLTMWPNIRDLNQKTRCLNLSNNHIRSLPPLAFKDYLGIQKLILIWNDITSLSPSALNDTRIVEISLRNNKLKKVPIMAVGKHLMKLDLSWNVIKTLDDKAFKGYTSLRDIRLEGNGIIEVSPDAFAGTVIAILYINFNRLKCIPSLQPIAKTLQFLQMGRNSITNSQCLGDVSMSKIPFPKLSKIYLFKNQLEAVPSFISSVNTATIQIIDLSQNKISIIQECDFIGIGTLYVLRILDNLIHTISLRAFERTNIVNLDLSKNRLTCLSDLRMIAMKLKTLSVSDNRLGECKKKHQMFKEKFAALKQLHLSNNGLTHLPQIIMKSTNLRVLDIEGNNITSLPPQGVWSAKLKVFKFSDNPLICLPDVRWLKKLQKVRRRDKSDFICNSAGPHAGASFRGLMLADFKVGEAITEGLIKDVEVTSALTANVSTAIDTLMMLLREKPSSSQRLQRQPKNRDLSSHVSSFKVVDSTTEGLIKDAEVTSALTANVLTAVDTFMMLLREKPTGSQQSPRQPKNRDLSSHVSSFKVVDLTSEGLIKDVEVTSALTANISITADAFTMLPSHASMITLILEVFLLVNCGYFEDSYYLLFFNLQFYS